MGKNHDCGGYCDKCAEELYENAPKELKEIYEQLLIMYGRLEAMSERYPKHNNVLIRVYSFLHAELEILEIDMGIDGK